MKGSITTIRESLSQEEIKGLSEIVRFLFGKNGISNKTSTYLNDPLTPYKEESAKWSDVYQINDHWERDAFRHTYTSAVLTYKYGEGTAGLLGDGNELWYINPTPSIEKQIQMDLWNNAVGRDIGKTARCEEEIARFVYEAYKDGSGLESQFFPPFPESRTPNPESRTPKLRDIDGK